jgi:hypothetical protein
MASRGGRGGSFQATRRRPGPKAELYRSHVFRDDGHGSGALESTTQAAYTGTTAELVALAGNVPTIHKGTFQKTAWHPGDDEQGDRWDSVTRNEYAAPPPTEQPRAINQALQNTHFHMGNDKLDYSRTNDLAAPVVNRETTTKLGPISTKKLQKSHFQLGEFETDDNGETDIYKTTAAGFTAPPLGFEKARPVNNLHALASSVLKPDVENEWKLPGRSQTTAAEANEAITAVDYNSLRSRALFDKSTLQRSSVLVGGADGEEDIARESRMRSTAGASFEGKYDARNVRERPAVSLWGSNVVLGSDTRANSHGTLESVSAESYVPFSATDGSSAVSSTDRDATRTKLQQSHFQLADATDATNWESEQAENARLTKERVAAAGGVVVPDAADPALFESHVYMPSESKEQSQERFTTSHAVEMAVRSNPGALSEALMSTQALQETHLQFGEGAFLGQSSTAADFAAPEAPSGTQQAQQAQLISNAELQKSR